MTTTTTSPVTMAKLLSRHEVAEGTTAFRFEKPSNWTFKSGQHLDMTLLDPSEKDAEGNVRYLRSLHQYSKRSQEPQHEHSTSGPRKWTFEPQEHRIEFRPDCLNVSQTEERVVYKKLNSTGTLIQKTTNGIRAQLADALHSSATTNAHC